MWLVNIQILLHIIAVVCELMVLVSNRVVLLVVDGNDSAVFQHIMLRGHQIDINDATIFNR